MPLPTSGSISISNVNTELGLQFNAENSLGNPRVRTLFTVPSGQISLSNGRGKSRAFIANLVISSDTTDFNLRTSLVNVGWDQVSPVEVVCTINSGVTVYASSTAVYAFNTGSVYPPLSVLTIVNNGTILGRGGNGGNGVQRAAGGPGTSGGPALFAGASCRITNNGRISGGGGGGGAGGGS